MKVVQVLPDLDGGGVERGTLEVARGLVAAGHESLVISAGGKLVPQLEREGSRHLTWDLGRKSLFTLRHIWSLRRWMRDYQPDIIHLRSRLPAWIVWLAWKGLPAGQRPHLVTTVHGLYSVSGYSAIMCRGERVIAVSQTVMDYIQNNYPETDSTKLRLINRGIDPEEFPYGFQPSAQWREAWYQQYPQLVSKKVLTLPGRITRLKGHQDLITLVAALKQAGIPVHALIVGGEDPRRQAYADELRARIREEGLDDWITFTGARGDIREIYAVSDVVLSLSNKPESFGRTVVECLSLGVPVAGFGHGGVAETLAELYPEGLVAKGDLNELQQRLQSWFRAGAPEVSGNAVYTLERMISDTLAVYDELTHRSDKQA
ncbi:glycosyltransferase family 4 protein [Nitrincola sp. MINF-07-Sa-05]|uniref:glycosyltransferase family 4 protein n=1 Tax=Nitrincola salilacus TaxID=3400273 RepID=UPI003917E662